MPRTEELPSLGVENVSERASETSRLLLDAYYLQDEREGYLLRGESEPAADVATEALDRMAATYEREFPGLERSTAREAGRAFMRGLFLQDEIENWAIIRDTDDRSLSEALLSDPGETYGHGQVADDRWDDVESELRECCRLAGIDEEYAARQRRFWLLHGQLDEYWEEVALDAQKIKLRAMIDDADRDVITALADYFVTGVKLHDQWTHREKKEDIGLLEQIVAEYYQKLFELRAGDNGR